MDPPRRVFLSIITAGVAIALAGACAGRSGREEARAAELQAEAARLARVLDRQSVPVDAGELRVRLAFGAGADLDLYVTDPLQETVYFANNPSEAGGRLERDLRCDSAAPRVETVRFPAAKPGLYRVGIDFPEHCAGRDEPAAFTLRVEREGASEERRGAVQPLHFLAIVHETRVPE
jgi:hypothetical protein